MVGDSRRAVAKHFHLGGGGARHKFADKIGCSLRYLNFRVWHFGAIDFVYQRVCSHW